MQDKEGLRRIRTEAFTIEDTVAEKQAIQVLRAARENISTQIQYSPDGQRQLLTDLSLLPARYMLEKARVIATLSDNQLLPDTDHPFIGFFRNIWQVHEDHLKAAGQEYEVPVLPGDKPREDTK